MLKTTVQAAHPFKKFLGIAHLVHGVVSCPVMASVEKTQCLFDYRDLGTTWLVREFMSEQGGSENTALCKQSHVISISS